MVCPVIKHRINGNRKILIEKYLLLKKTEYIAPLVVENYHRKSKVPNY